jgi:arabinoxylan arabinofuranohydrolase
MKRQAYNPYLPSYEYVPDGEPHVFGDRLYIFGSHDAFGGEGFCINNYVCWSAPLDDLGNWQYEGVIYDRMEDPINRKKGNQYMNAPDVCRGMDGRYYLYYQLHLDTGCSVAVADCPHGPYYYYGAVVHPDGTPYGKKKGDAYPFDPAVLVDDDGRSYLYTGFGLDRGGFRLLMQLRGGKVNGGSVVELEADMKTVKGNQFPTIPGPIAAKGTAYEGHAFFEASSIRRLGDVYYLVYSSQLSHELCYATAPTPTGPWRYGGTIVSIGDIGLPGISEHNSRNFTGNTHGGMAEVSGQWYIFYHRQTNQQKCARQGCAEPITIQPGGLIRQAEMTSCGLNGGPLVGKGTYEARIACNLWGNKGTFAYVKTHHTEDGYPYFTQSGGDREENGDQYIANMRQGAVAGYKYFSFDGETTVTVKVRGTGNGAFIISTEADGKAAGRIALKPTQNWKEFSNIVKLPMGKSALYIRYEGSGAVDFTSFSFA